MLSCFSKKIKSVIHCWQFSRFWSSDSSTFNQRNCPWVFQITPRIVKREGRSLIKVGFSNGCSILTLWSLEGETISSWAQLFCVYMSDWICSNMAVQISLMYSYWVLWWSMFFHSPFIYLFSTEFFNTEYAEVDRLSCFSLAINLPLPPRNKDFHNFP